MQGPSAGRPRRWRLRNNILCTLAVLAVAPLLLAGALAAVLTRKALVNSASDGLRTTADSKAVALDRWLADKTSDTEVLAQSELLTEGRPADAKRLLELVRRQSDEFEGIAVTDSAGRTIAADGRVPAPSPSPPGEPAARLYRSADGRFRLALSLPLAAGRGRLAASVDLSPVLNELSEIRAGGRGRTYLEPADEHAERDVVEEAPGDDGPVLRCRRRLERFPYVLAVEREMDDVLGELWPMVWGLAGLAAAVAAAGGAGAWYLSDRIRRPIAELEAAARLVAAERFDRRLEVDCDDELGSLARSFNEMTVKLGAARNRLSEMFRTALDRAEAADKRLAAQERGVARSARLAALGTLSAGLAHEIRTPLTTLQLFVQGLEHGPVMDPRRREDLRLARRELDRLGRFVERFLDFARPAPPQLGRVDLHVLLDECLVLVGRHLQTNDIRVLQDRCGDAAAVEGDPHQIGQVVVNVLLNAVEAMEGGGTLRLQTETLRNAEGRPFAARLVVSDTGRGIPAEQLEQIFDPFFTTKPEGTGLGLAIAHSIVENHGGRLRADSRPGLGSEFAIELPCVAEPQPG